MDFGKALELIKQGKKVSRAGWNGKGMFVFLVPGSTFKVSRAPLLGIYPEGTEINYHAHIDMKTADGKIVPWLASQTDVLADDWGVVDEGANVEIHDGFTPWGGGECPVPPDTEVEVIFDDGRKGFCAAADLHWANAPGFSIIAYRVIAK